MVLVNLLIAQMSSIFAQVEERSSEFWNFAFVSSVVREYKDARDLYPAPLNLVRFVLWLLRSVTRCGSSERSDRRAGYAWEGGSTAAERQAEGRRHRRRQSNLCLRHVRRMEEQAALSLEAQVHAISKSQTDMDAKFEQRLEGVVSSLTRVREGLKSSGLIIGGSNSASPRITAAPRPGLGGSAAADRHRTAPKMPSGGGSIGGDICAAADGSRPLPPLPTPLFTVAEHPIRPPARLPGIDGRSTSSTLGEVPELPRPLAAKLQPRAQRPELAARGLAQGAAGRLAKAAYPSAPAAQPMAGTVERAPSPPQGAEAREAPGAGAPREGYVPPCTPPRPSGPGRWPASSS